MTRKEFLDIIEKEIDYLHCEINGFKCRIIRMEQLKHLCGYVFIPEEHPCFKKDYDNIDVQVHGGLTYANKTLVKQPEEGWWIGFDCNHCDDISRSSFTMFEDVPLKNQTYKNIGFVLQELVKLTNQLKIKKGK